MKRLQRCFYNAGWQWWYDDNGDMMTTVIWWQWWHDDNEDMMTMKTFGREVWVGVCDYCSPTRPIKPWQQWPRQTFLTPTPSFEYHNQKCKNDWRNSGGTLQQKEKTEKEKKKKKEKIEKKEKKDKKEKTIEEERKTRERGKKREKETKGVKKMSRVN